MLFPERHPFVLLEQDPQSFDLKMTGDPWNQQLLDDLQMRTLMEDRNSPIQDDQVGNPTIEHQLVCDGNACVFWYILNTPRYAKINKEIFFMISKKSPRKTPRM